MNREEQLAFGLWTHHSRRGADDKKENIEDHGRMAPVEYSILILRF